MSVSMPRRDPSVTRRSWAEWLDRFRRSGQTVAPFRAAEACQKRPFAGGSGPSPPKRLLPPPTVTPIRITPSLVAPGIELALTCAALVRVSADLIAAVVRGVEGRGADRPADHHVVIRRGGGPVSRLTAWRIASAPSETLVRPAATCYGRENRRSSPWPRHTRWRPADLWIGVRGSFADTV